MAVGINDLDDLDDFEGMSEDPHMDLQPSDDDLPNDGSGEGSDDDFYRQDDSQRRNVEDPLDDELNDPDNEDGGGEDPISLFLKEKGINPSAIKIKNDKGELEEVHFNDLSAEEQLDILKYNANPEKEDLLLVNKDERQFLDELYKNKVSINDYIQYQQQLAIQQYVASLNEEPQLEIDSLEDDHLFVLATQDLYGVSEEEAIEILNNEKNNPAIYEKKVNGLRDQYREKEIALKEQEEQQQLMQQQQAMAQFESEIISAVKNIQEIPFGETNISLSTDDMEEVASFILDEDATGTRFIAKALQDPVTLAKMAWFAVKGEGALSQIEDYFKKQISEVSKNSYEKGLKDGKGGAPDKSKTKTAKVLINNDKKAQKRRLSINDLDD